MPFNLRNIESALASSRGVCWLVNMLSGIGEFDSFGDPSIERKFPLFIGIFPRRATFRYERYV